MQQVSNPLRLRSESIECGKRINRAGFPTVLFYGDPRLFSIPIDLSRRAGKERQDRTPLSSISLRTPPQSDYEWPLTTEGEKGTF